MALRGRGLGMQTANYLLARGQAFCRWLVKDRRTPDNPLAHLQGGNVRLDRRHDRRELEAEELRQLLAVAKASAAPSAAWPGRTGSPCMQPRAAPASGPAPWPA